MATKKLVDLVGRTFGRLTVISRSPNSCKGLSLWSCLCSCGSAKDVNASTLKNGSATSCGCLNAERASQRRKRRAEQTPIETRHRAKSIAQIARMRSQAKTRGYAWNISDTLAMQLMSQPCYLCGLIGVNEATVKTRNKSVSFVPFKYNGIDRVDNSRGYEEDNVLPCCGPCNYIKRDKSLPELLAMCAAITKRHQDGLIPTIAAQRDA